MKRSTLILFSSNAKASSSFSLFLFVSISTFNLTACSPMAMTTTAAYDARIEWDWEGYVSGNDTHTHTHRLKNKEEAKLSALKIISIWLSQESCMHLLVAGGVSLFFSLVVRERWQKRFWSSHPTTFSKLFKFHSSSGHGMHMHVS